jgi:ribosome-associated toxin RatA of RatAB toxin-antitoxin module
MKQIAAAVASMLTLATATMAEAAIVTLDANRRGDAVEIQASAMLDVDRATAWQVLTGYDRYPEFIPDLRVSRIIARHGSMVTVEQSGEAVLWLFRMPIDVTYEIQEFPPDRLEARVVAGSLRALTSSYSLTPTAPGVRLDFTGHVVPGFALFGDLEQWVVRENIARQFQAIVDEIGRRARRGPAM